jgi:lysozyme family protein
LECFDINGGKILYKKSKCKKPINTKTLLNTLKTYYNDNPNDRGRETYAGITRKYNENWYGWRYIDQYKQQGQIKWNQRIPECDHWVMDFYLDIWVKEGFNEIHSQRIANYIFDFRVNSPIGMKIVQRALNDSGYNLELTNKMNPETIHALNDVDEDEFFDHLLERRITFYQNIVKRDSTQQEFLKHWLKRANTINS